MAFLKYCSMQGCGRLVPLSVKYCKVHAAARAAAGRERHKMYDKHKRNQEAKAFYNSTEWKYVRAAVLARDNNIDVYAYIIEGRTVPATTVHHITELSEDYSKRCDFNNLISVSEQTHSMIGKVYSSKRKKNMQKILKNCLREYKKRLAVQGV
ncbi:MAG: HNH endonuclease [Lachnospiraceae bacterium]